MGFTNHIWAVGVIGQKKWSWVVWTMLDSSCANALSNWKTKLLSVMCLVVLLSRNVFNHCVEMVEHLSNAIRWHAIHVWWRKTSILDVVPKWPDTIADMIVSKCVRNRWLNAFFSILILFGAHILLFYEWRVVYQWLGDNSDVTCVSIETFTWKDIFSVFSVLQGSVEALIRWGGKILHFNCLLS